MTAIAQPDLEQLEARRDDLFALLCRDGGTAGDWAELERLTLELRGTLLARLEAYLADDPAERLTLNPAEGRALRACLAAPAIDHAGCDAWLDSYAAQDSLPEED